MRETNILILSAGRRVELIQCFKEAAKKLGVKSKIVAVDISTMAPAIYFADQQYQIPRVGETGYLESIIKICQDEEIQLIVPTIDTELTFLSENKEVIETATHAKVLVSSPEVIHICRNKKITQKFFEEHGFGVPREITEETKSISFPVFIKPLDGSSSINAFKVNNESELTFFKEYVKNPIVQEYMEGTEYTVDAFLDFDSQILSVVPRERIAVRAGEIMKGKICKDEDIVNDVKRLLSILKPIGQITIQLMKTTDGAIKYIEINPRFGGGAPMSIYAGADSCEKLYRLLGGEKLSYTEEYEDGAIFLRFDHSLKLPSHKESL